MNANEMLAELNRSVVRTEHGSYVKLADVERLMREREEGSAIEAGRPKPKNFHEAKQAVRDDKELMAKFPSRPPALGSVGGDISQPSSRT